MRNKKIAAIMNTGGIKKNGLGRCILALADSIITPNKTGAARKAEIESINHFKDENSRNGKTKFIELCSS